MKFAHSFSQFLSMRIIPRQSCTTKKGGLDSLANNKENEMIDFGFDNKVDNVIINALREHISN